MTINQLRRKMNRATRANAGLRLKLSRKVPTFVRDTAGSVIGLTERDAYLHPTKGMRLGTMPFGFRKAV